MIPNSNTDLLTTELTIETEPSKNYKMKFEQKLIGGYVDELEAMKQVAFKILNTERYEYIIYSWNYGIELKDLYGEPTNYVCAELVRRITEALIQDDRINSVDTFEFDTSKRGSILTTFIIHTIFGDLSSEKVVNY